MRKNLSSIHVIGTSLNHVRNRFAECQFDGTRVEEIEALKGKLHDGQSNFRRIFEVIYALAEAQGYSRQQLFSIYEAKNAARGGFEKRIYWMGNR